MIDFFIVEIGLYNGIKREGIIEKKRLCYYINKMSDIIQLIRLNCIYIVKIEI